MSNFPLIFERWERQYSADVVRGIVSLLLVSRGGFTESELAEISGVPLPRFGQFFHTLR